MLKTAVVLSLGAVGLSLTSRSQAGLAEVSAAARALQAELAAGRTPAVQYRHFTPDSMLFAYDEGLASIEGGERVSERTTFHGLSVTKTVTAVAILQLVDAGLVDLDAPASKYMPDFPYPGDITVRQLMSHSAGIPNPLPLSWIHLAQEHSTFDSDAFFRGVFAGNRKVRSAPNRRFRYSNLGYVLLGRIVENVSGIGYEQYVSDRILSPIGLSPDQLGFTLDTSTHATGYHRRRSFSRVLLKLLLDDAKYLQPSRTRWQSFRPFHVNGAAYGGLIGTADGFARYVQALLDPGSGLLSEAARSALFTENILEGGRRSGMTLSWYRGELDGHVYFAHAGGGGGYYAEIRLYPELRRGSVIVFNRSGFSDARFLDRIDRHIIPGIPAVSSASPAGLIPAHARGGGS